MAVTLLNTIKSWFVTGAKPTETQFSDTFDSFRHKNDSVPVAEVSGINELLQAKASQQALTNHMSDENAHADLFEAAKQDLQSVLEKGKEYIIAGDHPSSIKILEADENGKIEFEIQVAKNDGLHTATFFLNSEGQAVLSTRKEGKFAIISLLNGLLDLTHIDSNNATNVGFETPLANTNIRFPAKPAGDYIVAMVEDLANLRPYKVYTALLTQVGTDAPTAVVLENTFGLTFTFEYVQTGYFRINSASAPFTLNKTFLSYNLSFVANLTNAGMIAYRSSTDTISIHSGISGKIPTNSVFSNAYFEIRVYN